MKFFDNITLGKVILIIIIIIVIYIIYKNAKVKFVQLTQPKQIILLAGESPVISSETQNNIRLIAEGIYNDIEDTPLTGHNYDSYSQALLLTDNELNFLADYYKQYLSLGKSLYSQIESQYFITSGIPAKLQTRLATIGKR